MQISGENGELEQASTSIFCRWWKQACALTWIIFALYEVGIGYDYFFSGNPLCPFTDIKYDPWYWHTNFAVLGGFCLIWLMMLLKVTQMKIGVTRAPHLTAFNIVTIGTIAT
eukprot:gene18180-36985_t